jgi:hypothetical protein
MMPFARALASAAALFCLTMPAAAAAAAQLAPAAASDASAQAAQATPAAASEASAQSAQQALALAAAPDASAQSAHPAPAAASDASAQAAQATPAAASEASAQSAQQALAAAPDASAQSAHPAPAAASDASAQAAQATPAAASEASAQSAQQALAAAPDASAQSAQLAPPAVADPSAQSAQMAPAAAADASAQSAQGSFTWRARVTNETASEQPNAGSPFLSPDRGDAWVGSNDFVASADSTWMWGQRVKVGGGLVLRAPSDDGASLRLREGYVRASVLSWLDVEGGKRLVRWGTGYAFTPTGLLDPPRDATDPQDRLGLNEGMVMARADAFRGSSAVTVAFAAPRLDRPASISSTIPRRLLAIRARTTVGGVELAAVASAADNRRASFGANFTHVVGRRLEYHGELLVHDDQSAWRAMLAPHEPRARRVSALIGAQYTFNPGINAIVEYYRDGNGLSDALWTRLLDGATATTASTAPSSSVSAPATGGTLSRPTRRDFIFLRGSRADTDAFFTPELIALIAVNDGGLTLVPTIRLAPTRHLQIYVRGLILTGPSRSADGSAPVASTLSGGITVVF